MKANRYRREISAALAFGALLVIVGIIAPSFFSRENLRDLAMNNAPTLLVAVGMTLVILVAEIDISVGSQFAVCSVVTGFLAKAGVPVALLFIFALLVGAAMGALNGVFIGWLRLPSIIVTLAMFVIWRDGLRWATEGAWIQGLPENFQWFGFGQRSGEILIIGITVTVYICFLWSLSNLVAGRRVYATGSDAEAAQLAGISPQNVVFWVFVIMGALTGIAALLNASRFSSVPGDSGIGLELRAIAAVVVGGTAISGGRGTLVGTLIGVALLGTIGTALTFLGINPFWEKAIQGAIILAALASEATLGRLKENGKFKFVAGSTA